MKYNIKYWFLSILFINLFSIKGQILENDSLFCIENIIEDYIIKIQEKSIQDSVIKINYKKINNQDIYLVNYLSLRREVKNLPFIFFRYRKYLILIYTGLENYICGDRNYNTNELLKVIDNYLYEDRTESDNPWEKATHYII